MKAILKAAKSYVERIQASYIGADKDFVLGSLSGALDRIQKVFPRFGSFVMEFIQNADDEKSTEMNFALSKDSLLISNNGTVFTQDDVASICRIGRSSKTPADYIGYLGVGFKSVFLISDAPEVHSGGFAFRFDKARWVDANEAPWQIIPIWIEDAQPVFPEGHGTCFRIPFRDAASAERVAGELDEQNVQARTLLFLRAIQKLAIEDRLNKRMRVLSRSTVPAPSGYETIRIQEVRQGSLSTDTQWVVFRRVAAVPPDVSSDETTVEWERDKVQTREVVVAFRLSEKGNLDSEPEGTAHIGVFSFLPLKEVPSGMNFLVHADFLTTPGRSDLARASKWNDWLAAQITALIRESCIPTFLAHEKWKWSFLRILFAEPGGHPLFEEGVKAPLRKLLQEEKLIPAADGSLQSGRDLVTIGEELRDVLGSEEIQLMYPGMKLVHPHVEVPKQLGAKVGPAYVLDFLQRPEAEVLLTAKLVQKDWAFFRNLVGKIAGHFDLNYFVSRHGKYKVAFDKYWSQFRKTSRTLLPCEGGMLARFVDCYTNPLGLKVPADVQPELPVVEKEVVDSEEFVLLYDRLNKERYYSDPPQDHVMRALTENDIREALRKRQAEMLTPEAWAASTDLEKRQQIRHLRSLWTAGYIDLKNFLFLTLPAGDGTWHPARKLVFPAVFKPAHILEQLRVRGLLDKQLTFLDSSFLHESNEFEVEEWRKFFTELGVDAPAEDEKESFAERAAVLISMEYEKIQGRAAVEVGPSVKPGYDLESKGVDGVRYIECKGSSSQAPEITLSPNENRVMASDLKGDQYFVYVVSSTLTKPVLQVVSGPKLRELDEFRVTFAHPRWSGHAKVAEFSPTLGEQ